MKLHDLKPAAGSTHRRIRVGRGIAAGKGKTAGRGTKGQKSRAGASIPAWFEGGQTPIHIRVPKLRGFKPIGRIEFQVVNIGRISAYAEAGRLGEPLTERSPYTVNPEVLRAAGLISKDRVPVKILGNGEVSVPMFVLADAFTSTARAKIEAAGGTLQSMTPEKQLPVLDTATAMSADAVDDAPTAPAGDPAELDGGPADTASQD